MGKVDGTKRADMKMQFLKINYGGYREEFEGYADIRVTFCDLYDEMVESLIEMFNVDNEYIWRAFNRQFRSDVNELEAIVMKVKAGKEEE